jgi:hypothetical protein
MRILTIDAPHFNAGIVVNDNELVIKAAPIVNYMLLWSLSRVRLYVAKKGWTLEELRAAQFPELDQRLHGVYP